MALVFLGLGSNIGNGVNNLLLAWQTLGTSQGVSLLRISLPYVTAPVGMLSEQWFTNAVGAVDTTLSPEELLNLLLETEREMGRDRSKGEDRIVDLDILYFDDLVLNSGGLIIPHPEIANRLFVLAPLEELAPDHLHPVLGMTTAAMRKKLALSSDQQMKPLSWSPNI